MRNLVACVALALALAACNRGEPLEKLTDACAGEKVVIARNSSTRGIELYARGDSSAAVLIGVVPANGSGEYSLPEGVTGVFVFPTGGAKSSAPISVRYRCVTGRPSSAAGGA